MGDAGIAVGNKPLDIRFLDGLDVSDDVQLEFVCDDEIVELPPAERKHKKASDQDLEEKIKRHKTHLQTLHLPDNKSKLIRALGELEQEVRLRTIEKKKLEEEERRKVEENKHLTKVTPEPVKALERKAATKNQGCNGVSEDQGRRVRTRAVTLQKLLENQSLQKTECSEKANKGCGSKGAAYKEEFDLVSLPKGKELSPRCLSISEDAFYDRVKDKARANSGEQAGPSSRQGLRSSHLKTCHNCDRKVSPTNLHSIGIGVECGLYCPSCSQKQFGGSNSLLRKHGHADDPSESSEDGSTKRGCGVKRHRPSPSAGKPTGSVVELFSSDEDDGDPVDTDANFQPLSEIKSYGLRSTGSRRMEDIRVAYPSKDDPEAVEVEYQDLSRLAPMEFLNDTVIDFYIKYMQRPESLEAEQKRRFHFFNSFFYKKLCETATPQSKKYGPNLTKLRKWTKGTNIFEKDYLFVPIHDKWHWSLAIICHPGARSLDSGSQRCILHLDSMNPGHKSGGVFRLLKMYLVAEWAHQAEEDGNGGSFERISPDDFSTKKVLVPQQDNESDCGLFLLHYIQCFIKEAPRTFKLSDLDQNTSDMKKLFGRNWFKPCEASQLREQILKLLELLFVASGAQEMPDKKATENMTPPCRFLTDSPVDTLQVFDLVSDHFERAEDMRDLERGRERAVFAHSSGQFSANGSSETSPSPEISTYEGNEGELGDHTPKRSIVPELNMKPMSSTVEPDHSQYITGETLQVYVELGEVTKLEHG